jgi:hypothetical protein
MHSVPIDRRLEPIINLETIPYAKAGNSTNQKHFSSSVAYGTVSSVVAADGTNGVRGTCVDGSAAWGLYTARGTTAQISNPALNDRYTVLFNMRASKAMTISAIVGTGTLSSNALTFNSAMPLDVTIATYRYTFSVNAAMVTNGNGFIKFTKNANTWAAGDWIELSKLMVVKGVYKGDFGAGDLPGWQWMGTANASTSLGYPRGLSS